MKTKEEILAKYFHKNILSESNENMILEAMEEYASEASIEIAIDFVEWIENNVGVNRIGNLIPTNLSKEQLFAIFLEESDKEELSAYSKVE